MRRQLLVSGWLLLCPLVPSQASTADVSAVPALVASSGPSTGTVQGIPFKQEPEATASLVGRTMLALLLCLGLGAGALYLLRARAGAGMSLARGRRVHVIESQGLGGKGTLVLVRWDAEELLLAHGEHGTTLLARAPVSAAAAPPAPRREGP